MIQCVTVRPHWAAAILAGEKLIENRNWWPNPSNDNQVWIGIHSAKRLGTRAQEAEERSTALSLWPQCPPAAELPRGAVLGAMLIVGVVDKTTPAFAELPVRLLNWCTPVETQQFAWVIGDVVSLPYPHECRGNEKLWYPPRWIGAKLESTIAARFT